MTDPLLRRLAEDLDDAFPEVVRLHSGRLLTLLRRSGAGPAAEDLTQEALLRAYRALAGFPPDRVADLQLRAWLSTIALNVLRNHWRARGRRPREVGLDGCGDASVSGCEPGLDEVDPALAAALAALPDTQRLAVVLRHVNGLPTSEVATVLEVPVGTAKSHISRGLSALRRHLEVAP